MNLILPGIAQLYIRKLKTQCDVFISFLKHQKWLFALLLISIFFSCNRKKEVDVIPEIKIAKTVPAVYINESDKYFSKHQDTVFYKDHFFTGYRFAIYPGDDTAALQSYFNGVEEGTQKKWFPNHQLQEERFYINGKKEGIHKGWWADGKLKFLFTVNADNNEGEFREWYSSGLLGKYFHYKNGNEEGSQRLWWDNGTVRANYVIREGKKYGLIGLKTCINPYDSINKK